MSKCAKLEQNELFHNTNTHYYRNNLLFVRKLDEVNILFRIVAYEFEVSERNNLQRGGIKRRLSCQQTWAPKTEGQ